MDNLKLNVYDDEGNVTKTCEAQVVDITFGTIRSLMKLLNVDNIDDTAALFKIVYNAWDQFISILNKCFPDMTEDDWDNVKLNELIPILIVILKDTFAKMLSIPKDDSKN